MTIHRIDKDRNFTVISNDILHDRSISLTAKGLLLQMLSRPDSWCFSEKRLAAGNKEGVTVIRRALTELQTAGYLQRRRTRDTSGVFRGCSYDLFERPASSKSTCPAAPDSLVSAPSSAASYSTALYSTAPYSAAPYPTEPYSAEPYSTEPYSAAPSSAASYSTALYSTAPPSTAPYSAEPYSAAPYPTEPSLTEPYSDFPSAVNLSELLNTEVSRTDKANTDRTNTEKENNQIIKEIDKSDAITRARAFYLELLQKNIDYRELLHDAPCDREIIAELTELMLDTVSSDKEFLRIGGEDQPSAVVKKRFLGLQGDHIRYVLECLQHTGTKVHNIRQYLLTALFNAPTTIASYYAAQVRHDRYENAHPLLC